jgi:hypothetical protein
VQITVKVVVRCDTTEALTFRDALAVQNALRLSARELNAKMDLVLKGKTEVIATVGVDGYVETLVNLGDNPNGNEDSTDLLYHSR